jgi:hypothetical protein
MAATIVYDGRAYESESATAAGDDLFISLADLAAATGWERKPQGLCLGDLCVPIPPGREDEFVAADGRFNLAEFARYRAQPVVHDDTARAWLFGESAVARGTALRSIEAPDFALSDLDGRIHKLSDYRGKKVLLLSWASW